MDRTATSRSAANVLTAACWFTLVTVMFGGYSLLRLLTNNELSAFQEQFFRAGHAHAGVLVTVGVLYALCAERAGLSYRGQVLAFATYFAGVLLLSGSFFVHMAIGQPDVASAGTAVMAPLGALVVAASILYLAFRLLRVPRNQE